jgi:zinc transporter, ZIP family
MAAARSGAGRQESPGWTYRGFCRLFSNLLTIAMIAAVAGFASVAGGLAALWRTPGSLLMSMILGFTSGLLIATVTFEMIPQSLRLGDLGHTTTGFACGLALIYLIDLLVNRGAIAGPYADQSERVEMVHRRWHPHAGPATVLAAGTTIEEWIEGLAISVSLLVEPATAFVLGIAITFDNFSEGLSIGVRIASEQNNSGRRARSVLFWTGAMGGSLFLAAIAGWFLFFALPGGLLAFLLAFAGGGLLYLTVTDLLPRGQERQYQQSAALAMAAGFLVVLILSEAL